MTTDFITTGKKVIQSKQIRTICILLFGRKSIKLLNIVLVLKFNSNLISFEQLRKTDIMFHDNSSYMMLTKDGKIIA